MSAPREVRLTVPVDAPVDRLDRQIARLAEVSRGAARRLIDAGGVYVAGRRCRVTSRPVGPGVELWIHLDAAEVARSTRELPPPRWVHRDAWMGVVYKPPGVLVQASAQTVRGTVEAWARAQPEVTYVALHHRLDREARGLVAFALHPDANAELARAFREHDLSRRYHVVVSGVPEADTGTWEHELIEQGRRRTAAPPGSGGKPMRAAWRVLARGGDRALLEVELHTGRTHQVRLQAAAVGHPVLGDARYGSKHPDGLHLQAWSLALRHPVTGDPLSFSVELPPAWALTGDAPPAPGGPIG